MTTEKKEHVTNIFVVTEDHGNMQAIYELISDGINTILVCSQAMGDTENVFHLN